MKIKIIFIKVFRFIHYSFLLLITKRPFHVIYFVTARCNARCKMCFYLDIIENSSKNLKNELTIDEIKQFLIKAGKVPYFSLSGGEPFLHKKIVQIVDYIALYNKPLIISIASNCSLPEKVERAFNVLCERHPSIQFELQMSIDGIEEEHDSIRQLPGLFQKVVETNRRVAALKELRTNLKIKICVTYSSYNQHTIEKLIDYIHQYLTFDRIILAKAIDSYSNKSCSNVSMNKFLNLCNKVHFINQQQSNKSTMLTEISLIIKKHKESIREKIDNTKSLGRYCNAGRKIVVINETGEVFPCEPLRYSMGNLKEKRFNLNEIIAGNIEKFLKEYPSNRCHCNWGCAQNISVISNIKFISGFFSTLLKGIYPATGFH